MKKREFYYPSADGKTQIHAMEWKPEGDPVCILQIVHGMAEYADRYDRLARFLSRAVNPYCFCVGGVGVKIEFSEDGPSLQDKLADLLVRQKSGL